MEDCPRCGARCYTTTIIRVPGEEDTLQCCPLETCYQCRWSKKEDDAAFERVVRRRLAEGVSL